MPYSFSAYKVARVICRHVQYRRLLREIELKYIVNSHREDLLY